MPKFYFDDVTMDGPTYYKFEDGRLLQLVEAQGFPVQGLPSWDLVTNTNDPSGLKPYFDGPEPTFFAKIQADAARVQQDISDSIL